ncbi:MAG: hypothetical protein M1840_008535 [Geoglossum simile]|nr:MAG: hypothetical protein M1840_008535 [Geoglossum simile]
MINLREWIELLNALEQLKKREGELVSAVSRNLFISVLIDGSSITPNENLVRRGREGGKEVARTLSDSVRNYIRQHIPNISPIFHITVRIFASATELSRVLGRNDDVGNRETVNAFIQGFASSHLLFDFIHIEDEEQGAGKLRETFDLHIYDCHCKHVIVGFSANSHFHTTFTGLYNDDAEISSRTTILTSSPNDFESSDLKGKFRTTTFKWLFRTRSNNNKNGSGGGVSITRSQRPPELSSIYSPNSILTLMDSPNSPISSPTNSSARDTPASPGIPKQFFTASPIVLNWRGQRLDPPIDVSESAIAALKSRNPKLCNAFYLRGRCSVKGCPRDHAYCPSTEEIDALRSLARHSPCRYSDQCNEEWCQFGHNCPWNCVRENCKFREVHGIDTRTVEPLLAIEG